MEENYSIFCRAITGVTNDGSKYRMNHNTNNQNKSKDESDQTFDLLLKSELNKIKEEEEMDKVQKHKEICEMLNDTYAKKNHDYGDSFGKTFGQWGIASAGVRLSDKFNRFCSLASGQEQMVNDEAITDTLLDMANYCIMTYMELEK